MICPKCRAIVPDNALICVTCLEQRNRDALARFQRPAMLRYLRGEIALSTVVIAGARHIKQFGVDQLYCPAMFSGRRQGPALYHDDADVYNRCCRDCRAALEKVLESVQSTEGSMTK